MSNDLSPAGLLAEFPLPWGRSLDHVVASNGKWFSVGPVDKNSTETRWTTAERIRRLGEVHDDLVKALEHARRNLTVALRVNVNLGEDYDPTEHVTIKEIDAALAKAMQP